MTNISPAAGGAEFRIGQIIELSFRVLHGGLWKFIGLSTLAFPPALLVGAGMVAAPDNATAIAIVGGTLFFIVALIIQAALVYGALEQLRRGTFRMGEALGRGFSRFWPILGLSALSLLAALLGTGVLLMVGVYGLLLVVPPLVALLCIFYVAIPVCLVEGWGVVQSLVRCAGLTAGYRWPILGLVAIFGVGGSVVSALVTGLAEATIGQVLSGVLEIFLQIYLGALFSVLPAMVYYRLRVIKDGFDINRIGQVFE